jgi:hypothetical protein
MATSFDVDSVKTRILNRLKAKASWQDILFFSTNSRIIDTISEEVSYLASYGNYLAREAKWGLARNRTSLVAHQDITRYKAHRKIGATGIIRVGLDSDQVVLDDWVSTTTYDLNDDVAYDNKYYTCTGFLIETVADVAGSLDGTYFILQDDAGSVGFWIDVDNSGTSIPVGASGADRAVEITTVTTGMTAIQVAGVIATAINTDSEFIASSSSNEITVTCSLIGAETAPADGDTGFTFTNTSTGDTPSSLVYWTDISVTHTQNVDIPIYTVFSDGSDVKFSAISSYQILVGEGYVDVSVVQGIPKSYSDTALGTDNEEFFLENDSIENVYYNMYINSIEWTEADSLLLYGPDDQVYEIENNIDYGSIYLKFGNSIFGQKLTAGATVLFRYFQTLGYDGNIQSSEIITTVDSAILDALSNPITVYCTNQDVLIGGKNIEDTESIRLSAPNTFQTGDRATSPTDYETIISINFSYVLKISVWGSYEVNIDAGNNPWDFIDTDENRVLISILTTALDNPSTAQKLAISEALNDYKSPTDIPQFEDSVVVGLIFTINAKVSNKVFTLPEVRSNIDTALDTEYSAENRSFFEHIRFSDYQGYIDLIEGIDYHYTTIQLYEKYSLNTDYDTSIQLSILPIIASTISVYVKDTVLGTDEELIGTDNGAGAFTNESTYDLAGSSINYTTGAGQILIDALPQVSSNYELRVEYSTTSGSDLVLTGRSQIFNYDNELSTFNVEYV